MDNLDLNKIMADLLRENNKCKDELYKLAYIDGCLDFYNIINKLLNKSV